MCACRLVQKWQYRSLGPHRKQNLTDDEILILLNEDRLKTGDWKRAEIPSDSSDEQAQQVLCFVKTLPKKRKYAVEEYRGRISTRNGPAIVPASTSEEQGCGLAARDRKIELPEVILKISRAATVLAGSTPVSYTHLTLPTKRIV